MIPASEASWACDEERAIAKITYAIAKDFFETLEDNEQTMGECAALGVTLTMFGYADHEFDVLAEMAEVIEQHDNGKRAKKSKSKR